MKIEIGDLEIETEIEPQEKYYDKIIEAMANFIKSLPKEKKEKLLSLLKDHIETCDVCGEEFTSNIEHKKDEQKVCPSCYF